VPSAPLYPLVSSTRSHCTVSYHTILDTPAGQLTALESPHALLYVCLFALVCVPLCKSAQASQCVPLHCAMSIREGDIDEDYVSEREPTQVAINRCPCRFQFLVCALLS